MTTGLISRFHICIKKSFLSIVLKLAITFKHWRCGGILCSVCRQLKPIDETNVQVLFHRLIAFRQAGYAVQKRTAADAALGQPP